MNKTPQEIRWKPKDLARILYYINDHFDEWYNDNYNFCVKAKENTGVIWDARSIYNMVHTLFKVTEDYLKVGTKSTTCTIIWENREIYDLMKQIYMRTNKRMKESNQRVTRGHKNDGHILKYGEFVYCFFLNNENTMRFIIINLYIYIYFFLSI